MCLIFFSLNEHPRYKLIVAANRDEFHNRLTAPAQFWRDYPRVLAGRDLEAMGTWLGITKNGRVAMLTNYRDPKNINPRAPSRGKLVSDYLIDSASPSDFIHTVGTVGKQYNGFNLLVGSFDEFYYYSNYGEGITYIPQGFYGLSNHLLDTPWPKVESGKEKIKPVFDQETIELERVFEVLYNDSIAPDALLPDTGLSLERERALSSIFIKTPNYGTRCSTVVLVTHDNQVSFAERTYDLSTFQFTTQSYQFTAELR